MSRGFNALNFKRKHLLIVLTAGPGLNTGTNRGIMDPQAASWGSFDIYLRGCNETKHTLILCIFVLSKQKCDHLDTFEENKVLM